MLLGHLMAHSCCCHAGVHPPGVVPSTHTSVLLSPSCLHHLSSLLHHPSLLPAPAGVQYLTYISLLNQVVMMGTQLYHDATLPAHHKYAAHQVALLYVSGSCLEQGGGGEGAGVGREGDLVWARGGGEGAMSEHPQATLLACGQCTLNGSSSSRPL
jgi:hypothetical protein